MKRGVSEAEATLFCCSGFVSAGGSVNIALIASWI
jgi:hypothetical protein